MTTELRAISHTPGITSLCLHRGTEVLHHNLPDAYGDATARDLCHIVAGIFSAYANADRPVMQGYFQYPESGILVVKSAEPKNAAANEYFLTFLVSDQAAVQAVLGPARAFLSRQVRGD